MKVLLHTYSCVRGGVLHWLINMDRQLRRLGHETHVFFDSVESAYEEAENALVHSQVGDLSALTDLCQREDFDIAHVHSLSLAFRHRLHGRLPARTRVVVTAHGPSTDYWFADHCLAFCGVSREVSAGLAPFTDLVPDTVYCGIDMERFSPPETVGDGPPIVAWSGRGLDIEQKNLPLFLDAARLWRAARFRIWIADADGANADHFGKSVGPAADVQRWERLRFAEMPSWYRAVAANGGCMVSTSRYEGLALNLLEAQASGCPCLGPKVVGVTEALGGEGSSLVFPAEWRAEQLADKVRGWLSDPEEMRRRSSRAVALARESFSAEVMARKYLDIYRRAAPNRRGWPQRLVRRTRFEVWEERLKPMLRRTRQAWRTAGSLSVEAVRKR
jgi:glycosyltransferase involved in cell wall biosynthesis